jgi:hypothetical protein
VLGKSAAMLAVLLALGALPVAAEHVVATRYTVLGYVKDVRGNARRGVQLELVREKTGFSFLGETDATGLYVIVARLGDESVGETLRLTADRRTYRVVARFDPADHATERGTRVDLLGDRFIETPSAFAGTLKRFLAQ